MSDVDLGECGDLHNGCLNITFADFRIYFTSLDDKRRLFQLNRKKNPFSLNENNVCQVFYFSCGCVVILASFDYQENIFVRKISNHHFRRRLLFLLWPLMGFLDHKFDGLLILAWPHPLLLLSASK